MSNLGWACAYFALSTTTYTTLRALLIWKARCEAKRSPFYYLYLIEKATKEVK